MDEDVGRRREFVDCLDPSRFREIDRQRAFATVGGCEHCRDGADAEATETGDVANAERLHLDDFCALVGQDLARHWSRDDGTDVDDSNPVQWSSHVVVLR